MKKLITISLLLLFCLNMLGYRMVAHYYAEKSTIDLQISVDQKKYNEAELVSLKLPLNQPYIINTDGYESLEGNMDYNGVNYQFIKKRITIMLIFFKWIYFMCWFGYNYNNIKKLNSHNPFPANRSNNDHYDGKPLDRISDGKNYFISNNAN